MSRERAPKPKIEPAELIDWERVYMPTAPGPDGRCGFEFHFPGEATSYCVDVWFHESPDSEPPADAADPKNYTIGDIAHWYTDDDSELVTNELVEQLLRRHGLTLQIMFETVLERIHLHEL